MFKFPKPKALEPSPFGRQVLTAMAMEPDRFHIYPDKLTFDHHDFGTFRIGWLTGRIKLTESQPMRKLTRADQQLILAEFETLLTRPVPVRKTLSAFEQAVAAGFNGSKTAWLESLAGAPGPSGCMTATQAIVDAQRRGVLGPGPSNMLIRENEFINQLGYQQMTYDQIIKR